MTSPLLECSKSVSTLDTLPFSIFQGSRLYLVPPNIEWLIRCQPSKGCLSRFGYPSTSVHQGFKPLPYSAHADSRWSFPSYFYGHILNCWSCQQCFNGVRGLPADGRLGYLRALRVSPYAIPVFLSAFAAFAPRLISSSCCSKQGSYSVPDNSKGRTPTISDRLACAFASAFYTSNTFDQENSYLWIALYFYASANIQSGHETLSGFRNLSKSRLYSMGSMSVIPMQYASKEPAALPRPGPT